MASGVVTGDYRGYHLRSEWSSTAYASGNYSAVNVTHKLVCDSGYDLRINSRTNACSCGEYKEFTSPSINTGGNTTIDLGTTTHVVYHDADGRKTVNLTTDFNMGATISGTYVSKITASGNITLDNINRQATITNAYDFTDVENPHFTFSNSGGYPMNVWLEPNPPGEHLCVRNNIPNTGSYTWSLTEEEWDSLRDKCSGKSCTVRIGLYTNINGSLLASYQDKTMTIVRGKSQANYKVNGEWKKALAFIKVNGEWKKSKVYKKINNEWKEGH